MRLNKAKGKKNFLAFLQRLYDRMHNDNKDILIIIQGQKRSAKSSLAYRIMWNLDPNWDLHSPDQEEADVERRMVYDTEKYMDEYNKNPPKFSWFMYDDAGVGIPAKRWYEDQAVLFGQTTQFGGNMLYGTIITVPDMLFIEPTSRSLAVYIIEMDEDATGFGYVRRVRRSRNLTHPSKHYPYLRVTIKKNGQKVGKRNIKYIYSEPLPEWRYNRYDGRKRIVQGVTFKGYHRKLVEQREKKEGKSEDKPKRKINPNSLKNLRRGNPKTPTSKTN